MRSVTVGTADLRAALTTVKAHACTDPEIPDLNRIRLAVDPVNVTVTASDRFTIGLALASVLEQDGPPDAYEVELLPDDVGKILSIFKAGKESGEYPEYLLRLDTTEKSVTVTDCSGMLDGRALKVPRLPTSETGLSHIPTLLAKAHYADLVLLDAGAAFSGEYLARFKVAAQHYQQPIVLEAHEGMRAILVRCGESFLGLLMPRLLTEDDAYQLKEWAAAWDTRLPEITQTVVDLKNGVGLVTTHTETEDGTE